MLAASLAAALVTLAAPRPLQTVAEDSGFRRTGRYDEVVRLCGAFAASHRGRVRCETFGTTPEGRPMKALVASADGTLTPDAARRKKRPVVFAIGGIHAGEIDGKDAGFWLLRDLLDGTLPSSLLKASTFVFVPVFNVDGHERFGPNEVQRPNQTGPEQMGWRTTAQNLNLNRDWVKAEAPEMRALLALLNAWDPILMLDLHVTDGAKFEHAVAVMVEPVYSGPEPMRALGRRLVDAILARAGKDGHLPLPFYPSFIDHDDPASGFAAGVAPPRFSQSYWAVRNRFGVLVETHSWKDYAARVRATRDVLRAVLHESAERGAEWLEAARRADSEDESPPAREVAIAYARGGSPKTIEFRGYAYERKTSEVSGKPWVRYDASKPQIWRVPYSSEVKPGLIVRAPATGYVVPAAHAVLVAEKLRAHGLRFERRRAAATRSVDVFRVSEAKLSPSSYEGLQTASLKGEWRREEVSLAPGWLWVPARQRKRTLLVHLLDPRAPDSLASWGFFNAAFEQKEYVEDYLLEEFARKLMADDPNVRAAFEAKLKSDAAFARDPRARLQFFAERHPARDRQLDLYPVYRD